MNTTPRKFYDIGDTANGFIEPCKKMTPMAELIEYLKQSITDEQYVIDNASIYHGSDVLQAKIIVNSVTLCINKATSLLPAEREMVGKARVTAPFLVTSENDVYEEEANDYFTQNYQQ